MQPTLAGDVLLLATRDRARSATKGGVEPVLAGALVCTDVMAGAQLSRLPTGRPRRREIRSVLAGRTTVARREVADALTAAGVLAAVEHRVLGIVVRRGFDVLDPAAWSAAEARLRTALRTPTADPGLAALAVLCAVSGIAGTVLPAPTDRQARRALAAHLNDLREVVGKDVAEVLTATRDAYGRRHRDLDLFVPEDGSDVYGDSGGAGDGGGGDGAGGGGGD